jgi:16S rRNA (cytosine1402-N4)-methyltransferase
MNFVHKSVLLPETINWLLTDPSGIYVDCTLGGAGHSLALAQHLTRKDFWSASIRTTDALTAARARLQAAPCQVKVVKGNFKELKQILQSLQIDTSHRHPYLI